MEEQCYTPNTDSLIEKDFDPHIFRKGKQKVAILGVCFTLLFSAFNSAQNLVGSLYSSQGYTNLGLISLLVLYFIFAISCLFANFFISRLPYKLIFVFSSLGYVSYTAAGIWVCSCSDSPQTGICTNLVIYAVVLTGASLCGFSASLIWIAQGGYVNAITLETPQRKGAFSGIFWALMQASQIVGSLMGMFILKYMTNLSYFLIMTCMGLGASLLFLTLPDVHKVETDENNHVPVLDQINNVFKLMINKRTRYFLAFAMLSGIIVTFYSGFLSRLVGNSIEADSHTDDGKKEISRKLSFTLICLGCFEIISGLVSGRLADKFNVYKLATVGTFLCLIGLGFSFLGLFTYNYFMCFVIAAVWGFCDCFFQTICQTIANQDFPGQIEIFQVIRFILSMTCASFFIINILLANQAPSIFLIIVSVCTIFTTFCCSQLGKFKKDSNQFITK